MCWCGRRHFVVLMTCLGLLISIGSRAVFTIVVTDTIEKTTSSRSIFPIKCINRTVENSNNWPKSYVFEFQLVYYAATLVTQVPAGIIAATCSPRRVSGVATLLTSILTILVRFALDYIDSWPTFLIRVLQGLIEGSIVPAFNGVLAVWAPKSERSVLVVIAYSGAYLSTFVADTVSGLLVCTISDDGSSLYLYGGIGIVWAFIWLTCVHDSPALCRGLSDRERQLYEEHHTHTGAPVALKEIPWRKIFTSLPLSAIFVASFNRNWIFAVLVTQLPQFYKDHYSMTSVEYGLFSGIPHILMTIVLIPVGITVNHILHKQLVSHTVMRKAVETIGFGVEGGCFLALGLLDPKDKNIAIVLICVGVGMSGFAISGYQVNCLDLAPRYTSVLTGIIRMGTVGAVISMILTLELTKHHGGWSKVFIIAGALHLFGVVYYLIFASGERQSWAEEETTLNSSIQSDHPPDVVVAANPATTHESGYDSDEHESLLSKTLRVERLTYSDELEGSGWFLSTI